MDATSPSDGQPVEEKKVEMSEEKLEDRYNKLKAIAVKLKKRVAEQADEITHLEQVKTRLTEKNQTTLRLQQEFDNAQDEIDRLKKAESQLQKDLKQAVDASMKLKLSECEKSAQVQSLTASQKALRDKIDKNEKIEEELSVWKSRAMELEKELQSVKHTDAKQEKRQAALLSLEMSDYEKKLQASHEMIESLKAQVETETKKRIVADQQLSTNTETIGALQSENEKLKSTKESLKNDVLRKSEKIALMQDEISKQNEKLVQKKSEMFQLETEFENCKIHLASESKALVDKNTVLQKTVTALEQKISALEENKRSRESVINNQKLEMEQLESEYRNYKVKAQAMLKSQKPDTVNPTQERDELENLQKIVQDYNSEISILKSDVQTLRLENENLVLDRSELNVRFKQLKTEMLEKEVWFTTETQKLKSSLKEKESALQKMIEERKREVEDTRRAHMDQLDDLKNGYDTKLRALKEQVEFCKLEHCDLPANQKEFYKYEKQDEEPLARRESPFGCPDVKVNGTEQSQSFGMFEPTLSVERLRMIPRGECEGSESAVSVRTQNTGVNYNLSFEQLLNASFDSNTGEIFNEDSNGADLAPMVKEELLKCQAQLKHVLSLLRDSESNCERLTQLCEALKEEIRRTERDKERREHLQENTEYLKNVLLKFMTLSGEDERIRLIPVFRTILRLSNDEITALEGAVKGGNNGQASEGTNKGWSGYLPKWTS